MGWLWSDTPKTQDVGTQTPRDEPAAPPAQHEPPTTTTPTLNLAFSEEQKARIFGRPSGAAPPATSHEPPTTQAQADAELEAFLNSLAAPSSTSQIQEPNNSDTTPNNSDSTTTTTTTTTPLPDSTRLHPDGTLNISPLATYPRTMSCRQTFDQAFYCQSIGGKFNDVYRYGKLKDCSEQWSAFWFCMRTRTYGDESKQREIVRFYAERDERRRRERGSSEDVWEIRTRGVERAFGRDPDADDIGEGEGGGREMQVRG